MLLTELVELLSEHFNISNNAITNILQNNNIRINQRLLLEKVVLVMNKPDIKKTSTTKTNIISEIVETKVKETKIEETKIRVEETKIEENKIRVEETKPNLEIKPTRGRGRPRKNTVMSEEVEKEEEICVEVEEVTVDGITYYKTSENVILSKDLTIEGIMRNGKIMKGVR